jgi:hypothetical protein
MSAYPWLVLLHIIGVLTFAFGHGTSAVVAFRIRVERDPVRIAALLDVSQVSTGVLYVGLLLLLAGGIAAGVVGQWFGQWWLWAAIGILFVTLVLMYTIASPYYWNVRHAIGLRGSRDKVAPVAVPAAELASLLDTRRPEVLAVIGVLGLVAIAWLMIFKPA